MNAAPFPYFGGKYRLLPQLTSYVPRTINTYVEPFFGSGTLFFSSLYWAENEIINDLNGDIYNFFYVLRNHYPKLKHLVKYTPYDIQTFNHAKDIIKSKSDNNKIRRAWALYVLLQQSIMSNRRSFARGSNDRDKAREFMHGKDRLDYCTSRLQDAIIENEDALKVCKRYDRHKTFIYLDPPYLNVRSKANMEMAYHNTVPSEKMHTELLEWARSAKGFVLISNYHNPLYDNMLKDWHMEEITVFVNHGPGVRGGKKETKTKAIEVLWSNDRCFQEHMHQPLLFDF